MLRRVLLLSTLGALVGCGTSSPVAPEPSAEPAAPPTATVNPLEDPAGELALWMAGFFSSAAQANAEVDYATVELHVVPVWPERADGPWLYVEQVGAETPDAPYRQRVYRLQGLGPGEVALEVYALPGSGQEYVGAWARSSPLLELTPEDLDLRDGCTLYLERRSNRTYTGGTRGRTCVSRFRRASYATSEVVIGQEGMTHWDRGYNAAGTQVWGAEAGPYRFDRVED